MVRSAKDGPAKGESVAMAVLRSAQVRGRLLGLERQPLLIVDDLDDDPDRLVADLAREARFAPEAFYPGVRAPAPRHYMESVVPFLHPLVCQAFGLRNVAFAGAQCCFSLVTTRPAALQPIQRIPHIDSDDPLQFAVLHYLCAGDFGGTGFFRHDATGFETITGDRGPVYRSARNAELAAAAPPEGYVSRTPPHYSSLGVIEARYNRLVVYRSCLLHCGLIPPGMPLSADPRQGRLTANLFLNYRPN